MKNNYHYLNSLKEIAEKNDGKLISTKWEGLKKKYRFELNNDQSFESHYINM